MDKRYFEDLSKLSVLSEEETILLLEKAQDGDEIAKNKVLESNLKLVVYISKQYKKLLENTSFEVGDLISEGNIGLVKAVEKYKREKGAKFAYYAAFWIKKEIHLFLKKYVNDYELQIPDYIELTDDEMAEDEPESITKLKTALMHLKPRERHIITQFFGLAGGGKKNTIRNCRRTKDNKTESKSNHTVHTKKIKKFIGIN